MDDHSERLRRARAARGRRDWPAVYQELAPAGDAGMLGADDLAALSDACWWLGRIDECLTAGQAAVAAYLDDERPTDAAMAALSVAISLALRGEASAASGWIARCRRVLDGLPAGPAHGYLRYVVEVEGGLDGTDPDAVAEAARWVAALGRDHGEPNLVALGVLGEGRALLRSGAVDRGTALLDEAMLAVRAGDLDPEWAGNIYCHLMAACHEVADIARAREWTEATADWLAALPAAVMFTGICRVHRSQVLQVTGAWDRAEQEAARVVDDLAGIHVATVAEAHYQVGELRRLRGDEAGAEAAYARARAHGRDPQPGLALLRLVQGHVHAAVAGIGAAVRAASADETARARLAAAQAEIALGAGDLAAADAACAALEDAAARYGTSGLEAAALQWRGAVALARGRPAEALAALRAACRRWHEVHAAYDAARTCVLLGRAYRALGDEGTAQDEWSTARAAFAELGATVARDRVATLQDGRSRPGGLTDREAEVLALVATGRTNREVADVLVLSEKTVARHLSNIFTKLDVSTRTEAAAFAYTHGIASTPDG